VIGGGCWGTALGMLLARNGSATVLWDRKRAAVDALREYREHRRCLPGIGFPETLAVESDLSVALAGTKLVLIAVSSEGFRATLRRLRPHLPHDLLAVVWATKGLELGSSKWLHEVIEDELGAALPRAVLSGPSFAREVALGLPTAVTVGSRDKAVARRLAEIFHNETFRVYTSQDVLGIELGGAVKNVLAIAAGISDGLGFGANARAALITRGLHEIMQFGAAEGVQRETLMGLSGLGDLVLTCTDDQSRNRRFGLALGHGQSAASARDDIGQAIEGITTARVVFDLSSRIGVEMPICSQVYRVLYEGLDPGHAVSELLARRIKEEAG